MFRRRVNCLLVVSVLFTAAGCGDGEDSVTVDVENPVVAFAPVVHLSRDEPFMPMGARWFLGRSALWFASRRGCPDGKVAVGRLLKDQRTSVVDWMFITGIGWGPAYWREPYRDSTCSISREDYRYYANQLTRPYDDSPDRTPGLLAREGYYLDLMNWGRSGAQSATDSGQAVARSGEAYYQRAKVEIDGQPGLRVTYWMLYGMNRPANGGGRPVSELTHEGDWERVEVLLRQGDGEQQWEPVLVRLADGAGGWRELPWEAARLVRGPGSRELTHPVLYAARASHTAYPRPGSYRQQLDFGGGTAAPILEVAAGDCPQCPRWNTWERLLDAPSQDWYGFGGAWGDTGKTSQTAGPLGPHGPSWPPGDPAVQIEWAERQP